VEIVGGWRFGKDPYRETFAIPLGPLQPLVYLVLVFTVLSPLLVTGAFAMLFSKWALLQDEKGWREGCCFC
jgi:hypothetical protein